MKRRGTVGIVAGIFASIVAFTLLGVLLFMAAWAASLAP